MIYQEFSIEFPIEDTSTSDDGGFPSWIFILAIIILLVIILLLFLILRKKKGDEMEESEKPSIDASEDAVMVTAGATDPTQYGSEE